MKINKTITKMSATTQEKKVLRFKEDGKGKNEIPTTVAPNAIQMGGSPTGGQRTDAELEATPIRDRAATDEQFATDALRQEDPRDALMTAKLELAAAGGEPGVTPFGQLIAKDSDFEWLRSKREAEAEANFQQWFASNFDHASPEQKELARQLWPDFYQQRLKLLEKEINLQRRIARLKVTGIQTKEDLLLQYAIESGFIDADGLNNILHPERARQRQDDARRQARFVRGLFNPKRLPRGDWGLWTRTANARDLTGKAVAPPSALFGTGNTPFSAIGTPTPAEERYASFDRQLQSNLNYQ